MKFLDQYIYKFKIIMFDLCISVVTAIHPAVALSTLRGMQEKVDLVVIDYHMPDMNGLELQERVQNEFELPVISNCPFLFIRNHFFFGSACNNLSPFFVLIFPAFISDSL